MTLQDSYVYQLNLDWVGRRAGELKVKGFPALEVAPPPEFSGESGAWTPEHLLLGATASCLMAAFPAIAEIWKLKVLAYRSRALARLEKVAGDGYRFTEITITPEIRVAAEDVAKAQKVLAKAERNCFVSNSLRTALHVEPHFLPLDDSVGPRPVTTPAEVIR
jgi:organic hydroperoxide reductase OsmC/OhrA